MEDPARTRTADRHCICSEIWDDVDTCVLTEVLFLVYFLGGIILIRREEKKTKALLLSLPCSTSVHGRGGWRESDPEIEGDTGRIKEKEAVPK